MFLYQALIFQLIFSQIVQIQRLLQLTRTLKIKENFNAKKRNLIYSEIVNNNNSDTENSFLLKTLHFRKVYYVIVPSLSYIFKVGFVYICKNNFIYSFQQVRLKNEVAFNNLIFIMCTLHFIVSAFSRAVHSLVCEKQLRIL